MRQATQEQVCPYCNNSTTRYAGKIGIRLVWRCIGCQRTFWPRKKGSGILQRLFGTHETDHDGDTRL